MLLILTTNCSELRTERPHPEGSTVKVLFFDNSSKSENNLPALV
jgi:hypothetical protein